MAGTKIAFCWDFRKKNGMTWDLVIFFGRNAKAPNTSNKTTTPATSRTKWNRPGRGRRRDRG